MQRSRFSKRQTIRPYQAERILARDCYVCVYCFGPASVVDHIVPYNYSQDDSDDNLVAACQWCNAHASDKVFDTLAEKRDYLQERRTNYLRAGSRKNARGNPSTSRAVLLTGIVASTPRKRKEPKAAQLISPHPFHKCDQCGKEFQTLTCKHRFCSLLCSQRHYSSAYANPQPQRPLRKCDRCGVSFAPQNHNHRFCSLLCQRQFYLRPETGIARTCPACGKLFYVHYSSNRNKCCSASCGQRHKAQNQKAFAPGASR